MYQKNYNLLRKLIEIKSNYEKDVKKEPSRNDFCYQHLKMALQELGSEQLNNVISVFMENRFWICIFTKMGVL